ncbi:MAG: hypothetical protein NVS2B14_20640 [Chamaesiphon sp.]
MPVEDKTETLQNTPKPKLKLGFGPKPLGNPITQDDTPSSSDNSALKSEVKPIEAPTIEAPKVLFGPRFTKLSNGPSGTPGVTQSLSVKESGRSASQDTQGCSAKLVSSPKVSFGFKPRLPNFSTQPTQSSQEKIETTQETVPEIKNNCF